MGKFNPWRLVESLSIVEAALLLIGERTPDRHRCLLLLAVEDRPEFFQIAAEMLQRAVEGGEIQGVRFFDKYDNPVNGSFDPDEDGLFTFGCSDLSLGSNRDQPFPDMSKTRFTDIASLQAWAREKGFPADGPIFEVGRLCSSEETPPENSPSPGEVPPYLNPEHPWYSARLATAVACWEALYAKRAGNRFDGTFKPYKGHLSMISEWLEENAKTLASRKSSREHFSFVINPDNSPGPAKMPDE